MCGALVETRFDLLSRPLDEEVTLGDLEAF